MKVNCPTIPVPAYAALNTTVLQWVCGGRGLLVFLLVVFILDQKLMKLVGRKVALMNNKSEFGHLCISYGYLGKAEPKENI